MSQTKSSAGEVAVGFLVLIAFAVLIYGGYEAVRNIGKAIGIINKPEGYRVVSYDGSTGRWTIERAQNVHPSGELFGHTIRQRLVVQCAHAEWRWQKGANENTEHQWENTPCGLKVTWRYPFEDDMTVLRLNEKRKAFENAQIYEFNQEFKVLTNEEGSKDE